MTEVLRIDDVTRLLEELPHRRLDDRLAALDTAARRDPHRELVVVRVVDAAQQHVAVVIDHDHPG